MDWDIERIVDHYAQPHREGGATAAPRLCDQPVGVKVSALLADPDAYHERVRAERTEEASRG